MSDQVFVARKRELAKLDAFLGHAVAGHGQVCFVSGEPGSGKTALVQEFARRALAQNQDLITATGTCNAQTGIGDAFLPCREVLDELTGGGSSAVPDAAGSPENAVRTRKALAKSGRILLEVGPALIGTLIPAATLAALAIKLGKIVVDQIKLADKFDELAKQKPLKAQMDKPEVDQAHIFEQYTNFLRAFAVEQPLLLVFDDLHWADASSLSLLFHLSRRIDQSRIMIIGAYRPEETGAAQVGTESPLEKLLSELKRYYGDITIAVDEEDEATTRAFVDACVDAEPNRLGFDFRGALYRHTAGNPLFITELMRHLRESGQLVKDAQGEWVESRQVDWTALPARVEGVIEERLQRLGKDGRATLSVASVEGETFTAEILARLQSSDEREMVRRLSGEMSKQHHLVEASDMLRLGSKRLSRYRFRHSLLQKYLYDGLDKVELSYLHEDIGNAIETFYADRLDDVVVQLAWHFAEAGFDEKASHYFRRAGELAADRYANAEAVDHLTHALALTPQTDARARFELLLAREVALGWQGKRESQAQDLQAAAELAMHLKDNRAVAEVSLRLAEHARLTGNYDAALGYAEQAAKEPAMTAQAYALWGKICLHKGLYTEAKEWLELALVSDGADRALMAQVTYDLGVDAYYQDRFTEAGECWERARVLYQELGLRRGQVNCLLNAGLLQKKQGCFMAARSAFAEALGLCKTMGWRHGEAWVLNNLGNNAFDMGDYRSADDHLGLALAIFREVGDRDSEAVCLDQLAVGAQRLAEAGATAGFHRALEIQRETGDRRGEGYTLTHLGHALADAGDPAGAAEAFGEALRLRRELEPRSGAALDDLAGLAGVALAQGDNRQAMAYAREILAWMMENGLDGAEYPVQVCLLAYRVLRAAENDSEAALLAQTILDKGYAILQEQVACVQDEAVRRTFEEGVSFNRELLAAWKARKV